MDSVGGNTKNIKEITELHLKQMEALIAELMEVVETRGAPKCNAASRSKKIRRTIIKPYKSEDRCAAQRSRDSDGCLLTITQLCFSFSSFVG